MPSAEFHEITAQTLDKSGKFQYNELNKYNTGDPQAARLLNAEIHYERNMNMKKE